MIPATDWKQFARSLGLVVEHLPLPQGIPAVLAGQSLLLVSNMLSASLVTLAAWHEIGHLALHAGDMESWSALPGGSALLARFEREAWQFALVFPSWDIEDILAALEAIHSFGILPGTLIHALARCTYEEVP